MPLNNIKTIQYRLQETESRLAIECNVMFGNMMFLYDVTKNKKYEVDGVGFTVCNNTLFTQTEQFKVTNN